MEWKDIVDDGGKSRKKGDINQNQIQERKVSFQFRVRKKEIRRRRPAAISTTMRPSSDRRR